jgi:hypothetical protein
MKVFAENLKYASLVVQFLLYQARLRVEGGYFQHLLYYAVSYITCNV